jgi:hypothetical protein
MEEVRFEDYMGRERQTTRFFHDEKEREELPLIAKAGIGLAAVAGLLAAGHRTGVIRRIAQFLDTETKATMRAVRETLDQQGSFFRGPDKLTAERMKKLKESFVARRQEILKDVKKSPKDILSKREMDMERYLRQRQRLIGEIHGPGNYEGEVPYYIQEGFRFAAVMDDIRQHSNLPQETIREIEKALMKGRMGILDWGSDDQLEFLLKNHFKGIPHDSAWQALKRAREKYRKTDFIAVDNDARRLVEGMQKKLREFTAIQMQNLTKKDNLLKRARIGHKQATVGDILRLEEAGKIRMNADLKAQIEEVLRYNKDFKEAVFDENLYISTKNDELIDYKVFSDIRRRTAEWWANTIPGGLLHLRDILNVKTAREQASFKIFERGTIQATLNAHRGFEITEPLNEEVIFVNGKFVKLFDYDAIENDAALEILNPKRDMFLTSSQFGTMGKMHRQMSELLTDNETPRNIVAEVFDVGRQDKDSVLTQAVSVFTKFFKKDWERNKIKRFMQHGINTPEEFFEMNTYFKLNTEGFSARVLHNLKDHLPRNIRTFIEKENINFSREEDILKLFDYIGQQEVKRKGTPHTELVTLYKQYTRNPDAVLNRKTPIGESNPILGHHTRLQTGYDVIHQQTSLYLLQEMLMARPGNEIYVNLANAFRKELKGLYLDGKIFREDLDKAEELLNYSMFRSQGFDIFDNRNAALNRVSYLFQNNQEFQDAMRNMVRRTNPMWERFSEIRPENKVGDEYLAINKTDIGGIFNRMFGLKSGLKERAEAAGDLFKQLSPFTGRRNMEDVTTLTLFGNYYPVYRLQDALGNIGLGFSDQSMGNAFQMFSALMWKRIFPVYAAVEGVKYVDWKMDQWTGEGLDERWENYKANARLEAALERNQEEIYQMKRERMLKPGLEHWEAMPEIHIPGIGPVGMGDVLNNLFGIFLGKAPLREEDMMTYEETLHDLYYGTEEIRKSRWWFMGSKSAYRGDRIIEFAPNSFRLAHSDYEWTNTNATGEEYWSHHLLPTLENPLGGLSYLFGLRDPYWWERKHYYDRPYLLTGELFNPNTMVLGDIGNATIGRLIKPVQEMHPEYWGDPILIYENETSQLGDRPTEPVRTRFSPGGRIEHDVLADVEDYGVEYQYRAVPADINEEALANIEAERGKSTARYFISEELGEDGTPTGAYVVQDMETNQAMYVPANVAKENIPIDKMFEMANASAPNGTYVKGVALLATNPSYNIQVSTQPRAMMDEEFAYKQDILYRKMANIRDPRDGSWRLQEGIENWTEPLGVYKWIAFDELLGYDPYAGQMVIQRADAAYNASNRFWESELGSLGSQLSEIGRRFVRRDSGQMEAYNPVRNTMPDWLPGDNYFINFQIGDVYSKIPNGERRLPGEAYEALHELHPDEFGRYGAFDRFKILADVAPWSDEYKFWSQYLLDNLEDEELRKEAAEIRRQVAKRKQKYEFYPYQFKGQDLVYEEVTVKKFLDDYTFLTEEFPDTPIRLAGVEYRKKAPGVLQNYFEEGDKVVIGVAADPTRRIAKDTYGTMRAVIFNELGNINQDIIRRGRMVENMNDFSPAGVHARFTPQEIARGARWETIAHASSPLNTKFLQVRTALEEYERDQIYGKDFATWENFMLSDYIIPTLQGLGRFDNPLWSMTAGATTGLVLGRFFLKGGRPTKIAAIAGALYGLGANLFFKHYENKYGEAWIPERRRIEHEINEYFDILKYLKYEGLYQKAREEIAHATGYDIEDFAQIIQNQKELNKQRREELEAEKKRLYLEQPEGWEERREEINRELETISQDWDGLYLPEAFLQALKYREERDTTLYAVDPLGDRMQVMRAFPYKDKWFFNEFVNATQEERERILKLVPENQRRIYKAIWGMEVEEPKPLEYYMQKYHIPDWTWEGWRPEYNLEDIKVKVVQEYGLDLSDFNFWEDDVEASKYVPDLHPGGNDYHGQPATSFAGYQALRQNLIHILQGQGLQDVQVTVIPSDGTETQVNFVYTEDRSEEIEEHLRKYGSRYV